MKSSVLCHSQGTELYSWNENVGNDDERYENGDRAGISIVMDMKWRRSKPPPVSVKARTVVGPADRV